MTGLSAVKKALLRIEELERENALLRRDEPVAIVGMSCRFPGGVRNTADYWRLLSNGIEAVRATPPESRWSAADVYAPDPDAPGKAYTTAGGFLDDDVYAFDAPFFGITPVEAIALDPQQRLLLELAWEALEDGGVPAERIRGTRTGVFTGISAADYAEARLHSGDRSRVGAYDVTGLIGSTAAGRIAYTLDLRGPAMAVDTACSSSLVAIDLACGSLREGTSDWAFAAGVNVILTPVGHICFSKMRALSPDGRCRAFDAAANGFVRAEGGGMLLLRRLSDARRDGDRIVAVIRGSAVNHDGRSNGLTAPNLLAQEDVLRAALARAGLSPHDVDYVEAHGTGTPLGDPIELEALANVFAADRARPLRIGSVKTNIGHLETAAGMAGIVKVVLALRHGLLPASLHFTSPTEHFDWDRFPLRVVARADEWRANGAPRRAGISGFGFGGTNAHVIVEEAPQEERDEPLSAMPLLLLSAKSETSLAATAAAWRHWIAAHPEAEIGDVCAASRTARTHFAHRLAAVAVSREELLDALANGRSVRGRAAERPRLAFAFSGQGSHYAGMASELYEREPLFRARYDECEARLRDELGFSIRDAADLSQTLYAQPALFALGWSLAELWRSWGIEPAAVFGHSLGEITAAAVAGVFPLPEACRFVAARAQAMQAIPAGGGMLAVFESAESIAPRLGERLAIAAINGPRATVVAGDDDALAEFAAKNAHTRRLAVSHPFHSPRMQPAAAELERVAASMHASAPRIALVSNVTGAAMSDAPPPAYWRDHLLSPVRFMDSVRALRQRGITAFLEIGPSSALVQFGRQVDGEAAWLSSLRKGTGECRALAEALAELHVHGIAIDWKRHGRPRRALDLPTYRFERKRYVPITEVPETNMPVEPANVRREEITARITAIVREATGLESLSRDVNLLELGVDSLMLMQARHQIAQAFGVEIPLSQFFERLSTIGRIAEHLAECSKPAAVEPPPPASLDVFVPYKRIRTEGETVDERQREHLQELVRDFCAATEPSKRETQAHRSVFANNRNVAGFRPAWKEMIYQIVAESAEGSRIVARGGRELIDFTMGFGVHLFGHNAPFIREAVARELERGFPLGPMYHLAGEVAEAFCALTGNERVAFYNSGTEAVMVALRIARTVTGRSRIVLFEGSYHGSFDGILALRSTRDGQLHTIPGAPGTTQGMVDDVVVLRYDDPATLDFIREQGSTLAAVLVEPVQSRRPDLRPRAFLHALREITARTGTALIFDEVVTGFRCHSQGAQGYFGVSADLATYGKVVGGGMPIGLVAGKAAFMDAVDGGAWSYGDDSFPRKTNTFVAGTFCHHPLTLAAMRAVLARLREEGPALQETLTRRTAALCQRLDRFFEEEEVPIRMATFGSLFRFVLRGNAELLFFHLIRRGFYIWEGRNCFLSTAHSDEDLDRLYDAVVDSVRDLRRGGIIPERTRVPEARVVEADEPVGPMEFSLFFFSSSNNTGDDKYRLLIEAAKYADRNGYTAVWTPERHFHDFGGLYPNPAVTGAALATITQNVRIRAGSTVLLLHDPIRFAENWSLVDNLSHGRVDLALALGWNSNDFALAPERFEERARLFPEHLDVVRRLWRGESVSARGGKGEAVNVELHPRPVQRELPVWYVAPGNPDTFRLAGEQGGNLLTYLEGQTIEQLAEKLSLYRSARSRAGHRGRGHVTLMLHTFLADDPAEARAIVAEPMKTYLRGSFFLRNQLLASLGLAATEKGNVDPLIDRALDRYLATNSLIGSIDSCIPMVRRLREIGVDELGCLIDFGLDFDTTMRGLESLTLLKQRLDDGETLPLSDEQKELWATVQLNPRSTAYNEAVLLRIGGVLQEPVLRRALRALMARHDALRVAAIDGETQRVVAQLDPPLEVVGAADADAWLATQALRPFDLSHGPLFRVGLIPSEGLLCLVAHHIVANGWSIGVFIEELSALCAGNDAALPPPVPFRAFLDWQAAHDDESAKAFWRDALRAPCAPLDLGGPAPGRGREASRYSMTIDRELYHDLERSSKQRGVTLTMTMLAGFELLLARVSGRQQFAIGVPLSRQAAMGATRLAGQCTAVLPWLCDAGAEWTLDDLVRDARNALLRIHEHANVRLAANGIAMPQLSAMFNMDRTPAMASFAGLPMTLLPAPIGDAKLDLLVNAIDLGDRVAVDFDVRRAAIDDGVAAAWADAYRRILTALADPAAASQRAFELPIADARTLVYESQRGEIRDAAGNPVPPGVTGEWTIDGKGSGILLRERGDGTFEWAGRRDRAVTIGGRDVNLAFVETLLRRAGVDDAAVNLEPVDGAPALVAKMPRPTELVSLRRALLEIAPPHLVPSYFIADGRRERGVAAAATPFEERLAPIWTSVLRISHCDPDDSFVALGGASVEAAQFVARVRQELGVELELQELFAHPTLRELAALLAGRAPSEYVPIPQAPPADDDPLSHAQRRLWLVQQLDPAMTAYNIPVAAWLDGPLDCNLLRRAFDLVAGRHDSLRTIFVAGDGEARQRVVGQAPRLEIVEVENEAAVLREIESDAARPFVLDEGPLLRARLLCMPRRHALALDVHHIIADGWSIGVMMRELAALYRAGGEPLPPLPIQYRDFAIWQLDAARADERGSEYWLSRFAAGTPRLSLRTDAPRPMVRKYAGGRLRIAFDAALRDAVLRFASRHGTSTFVVLLAALKALLYRTTGDDDIVIGVPVSGRGRADLDEQIGLYVNTLPLRDEVRGSASFSVFLATVARNAVAAFAHGEYPLDLIVEQLDLPRDWSRTPLFDVVAVWDDVEGERFDLGDVRLTRIDIPQRWSLFDLVFHFIDDGSELRLDLDFDTALFRVESIALMQQRFVALLRAAMRAPDAQLRDLDITTDSERSAASIRLEASFQL